jgi:hypothetical protein
VRKPTPGSRRKLRAQDSSQLFTWKLLSTQATASLIDIGRSASRSPLGRDILANVTLLFAELRIKVPLQFHIVNY